MKTIANLGTIQEAQLLKLTLGSAGINAFIPDEISADLAPYLFLNRTGIRVQVAEDDEDEARKIIDHGFDNTAPLPEIDGDE